MYLNVSVKFETYYLYLKKIQLGRGMGSLVGGFMMRALSPDPLTSLDIGTRATFRYLGVAAFATGFFYFLFNQLYIRPRAKQIMENSSSEEPNSYSNKQMSALENVEAVGDAAGQTNPVFIPDEPEIKTGSNVMRKIQRSPPMSDRQI